MKLRENLDDFMSIVCFKAAIVGMEDILGEEGTAAALIAAGRQRGKDVANGLGLTGSNMPTGDIAAKMDDVFGNKGTKLCAIQEVTDTPEGGYLVKTGETVCMAGEPQGSSRYCTYTMGAIMGCMESITGKSLIGKHVAKITEGSATDDLLFTPA